jgi:hypothetical protein
MWCLASPPFEKLVCLNAKDYCHLRSKREHCGGIDVDVPELASKHLIAASSGGGGKREHGDGGK